MSSLLRLSLAIAVAGLCGCRSGSLDLHDGAAADSGSGGSCVAGTLRCPCDANNTCTDNLVCLSQICVELPGSGGTMGSGGGGGTGGVAGSGGITGSGGGAGTGGAGTGGAGTGGAGTGGAGSGGAGAGGSGSGGKGSGGAGSGGTGTGGAGTGGAGTGGAGTGGAGGSGGVGGSPIGCGDANLAANEACDDGNWLDGDGCSADCQQVQPGYSCIPPGQKCHPVARCGDGVTIAPEQCDDGNRSAGDGCSATCKIELGFKCTGRPSVCTATLCGDSKIEGAETCDDGNALPWDGCSADCQIEPDCSGAFGCTSRCGDGLVLGELCDDGNNISGDGCSSTCQPEPGFTCTQPPMGDRIQVPVVYRDFRYHSPADFEPDASGISDVTKGMVLPALDGAGKPVFTGLADSYVTSASSFNTWYRDVPGTNFTVARKLTLWRNVSGDYENRHGPNGELWQRTITAYYCGSESYAKLDANGLPIPCTTKYAVATECDSYLSQGLTQLSCTKDSSGTYQGIFLVENMAGTPVFFPVDDVAFTPASERESATIAPVYGDGWYWTDERGKPLHNFSFTSEIRTWFLYDSSRTYTLQFTGDDDVWFFINRTLAADLGGIHTPADGSVTITPANAASFGLAAGGVYEVAVFHAERQTSGSSFRLTISGFNTQPSTCKAAVCGDGKVGAGEECDDGVNAGGYGKCGPGCMMGAYCGDGLIQPAYEDCDTLPLNGVPCPTSCRFI